MRYKFEIRKNKRGYFVAYFLYNSEVIWWTEGYTTKSSAKNAIACILRNGPSAEIINEGEEKVEKNNIQAVKNAIKQLTYDEMMELAVNLESHSEIQLTECAFELCDAISSFANSE